ncbi:2-hydroxy-3-oxopropionate reductase [Nitrosomonas sp.]|uniref:2-hydroxy-3-oxopropionate reductase n=1 Tax=Nitrosomonas sp. TaxID=42353 RepID=UPI001DAF05F1|nr:2-hydroxy-3-oxopropionate reductase [Nitrosomonas sp.]MBX3617400.1 2-hydroxy-3-oxopropionate reductase [Nitrosomonas sp.]
MANIGFIGLGIMGKPMAGHLIKGGHRLWLQTRSGVPDKLVALGGSVASSPEEVAHRADIIITMLPDTPDVEKVLFGDNGVVSGLHASAGGRKVIVDMSSISPLATREFAARLNALGHDYADAPVSGGDIGARDATLTIMVGASQAVFDRIQPILALMGKSVTHIGDIGAGQVCKVANQIVVSSAIEAVGEALLFASKAGVDPSKVRQALLGGFAASKALEVHGQRMIERRFEPGFRIELHHKDLNIALQSAAELGVSLPTTAAVRELFSACLAHGGATWDNSAIVKMLEKLANHEIHKYPE